jgi:tetratricopeptide (TPR) repeat protein
VQDWTCGSCGLAIRSERLRCPRCSELLERPSGRPSADLRPDGGSAEERHTLGRFGVAAAAVLVVGAGVWATDWSSAPSAPAPAATVGARPAATRLPARTAVTPGTADPYQAVEAGQHAAAAYAQGDLDGALAGYEAALAANPDDAETRNNLAQLLVRLGRADEALPHFEQVIAAHPDRWAYRFNRGRAYAALNRWADAVVDYQTAAATFPDDYATHYNLGLAHARLNAHAAAATAFERAVALAPGESSFLVSLGTEYIALNRIADARTVFEQYLREQPQGPDAARVQQVIDGLTAYAATPD